MFNYIHSFKKKKTHFSSTWFKQHTRATHPCADFCRCSLCLLLVLTSVYTRSVVNLTGCPCCACYWLCNWRAHKCWCLNNHIYILCHQPTSCIHSTLQRVHVISSLVEKVHVDTWVWFKLGNHRSKLSKTLVLVIYACLLVKVQTETDESLSH